MCARVCVHSAHTLRKRLREISVCITAAQQYPRLGRDGAASGEQRGTPGRAVFSHSPPLDSSPSTHYCNITAPNRLTRYRILRVYHARPPGYDVRDCFVRAVTVVQFIIYTPHTCTLLYTNTTRSASVRPVHETCVYYRTFEKQRFALTPRGRVRNVCFRAVLIVPLAHIKYARALARH